MSGTEVQNDPDLIVSVKVGVCQLVMAVFCLVCFPHDKQKGKCLGRVFASLPTFKSYRFIAYKS